MGPCQLDLIKGDFTAHETITAVILPYLTIRAIEIFLADETDDDIYIAINEAENMISYS